MKWGRKCDRESKKNERRQVRGRGAQHNVFRRTLLTPLEPVSPSTSRSTEPHNPKVSQSAISLRRVAPSSETSQHPKVPRNIGSCHQRVSRPTCFQPRRIKARNSCSYFWISFSTKNVQLSRESCGRIVHPFTIYSQVVHRYSFLSPTVADVLAPPLSARVRSALIRTHDHNVEAMARERRRSSE